MTIILYLIAIPVIILFVLVALAKIAFMLIWVLIALRMVWKVLAGFAKFCVLLPFRGPIKALDAALGRNEMYGYPYGVGYGVGWGNRVGTGRLR